MRYWIALIALIGWMSIDAQINIGLNGDLETRDYNVPNQGIDDVCGNVLDHALNWHSTVNSPDYVDPVSTCALAFYTDAHGGQGMARFVASGSASEFGHTVTGVMVAGTTYIISFYIKKEYADEGPANVGVTISPNPPIVTTSPYTTSVQPVFNFKPTSTQWTQYQFCYTATVSGMHYFGIGPHGALLPVCGYLLDDLVVTEMTNGTSVPTAELTTSQSNYCVGDQVLLDGSGSTNVTSYAWEIIDQTPNSNFDYISTIQSGSPGILDFSTIVAQPEKGHCYNVILQVYGNCSATATTEFCFENPTVPFVNIGTVCANQPVDIVVDGDDGWTYVWSQGSTSLGSGVGLQQITVSPSIGSSYYHVDFTTPEGCTGSQNILVNASNPNNLPPTMNGINGTGDYTYYVQQGGSVNFTSLLSNDNGNETLNLTPFSTVPGSPSINYPNDFGDNLSVSWQTLPNTMLGEYHIILIADDRNACSPGIDTFDFKIIVICNWCQICVDYEGNMPNANPLPEETRTGKCIQAGITDETSTGNANVGFYAGEYIELGDFFDAGPGFTASIEPTCLTECADCCSNSLGFTFDPIPNVFTPNNDGVNDIWFVHDYDHELCAFGATGFELYILNSYGNVMYEKQDFSAYRCCPYQSFPPDPGNDNGNPTVISWDGTQNTPGPNQGYLVGSDVYYYVLYLHGCGQTYTAQGDIHLYFYNPGMVQGPVVMEGGVEIRDSLATSQAVVSQNLPDDHFYVFPNPTSDFVRIHAGKEIALIEIRDDNGKIILRKDSFFDEPISLSNFSIGTYQLVAKLTDGSQKIKTVVKK